MGNTNDEPRATGTAPSGGFTLSQEPVVAGDPEPESAEGTPLSPVPAAPAFEDLGELPTTYHEDSLFLVARDPHWLFSYWDFDWMRATPGVKGGRAPLFHLRIVKADGTQETSVEVRPEARNWYVPVSSPDTEYVAELGYFGTEDEWVPLLCSGPARTPADAPARPGLPVKFATVPPATTFEQLLALVQEERVPGESLVETVARLARDGRVTPDLGALEERVQTHLLSALFQQSTEGGPSWPPQLHFAEGGPSWPRQMFTADGGPSWPPQSFPAEGAPSWPPRSIFSADATFAMHVNAEVIFYGGTQPDARVTIDGQPIQLAPDGTFRYHFRLPDGDWNIPVVARSADGKEERSATLTFSRGTSTTGEVAASAQPPELPAQPMGAA